MQKITPFLWFDGQAEEAMNFYMSRFTTCGRNFRPADGQPGGWLQDKFGVSWQIVPTILNKLLQDKDAEKSKRVMQAMLQMDKIDINHLQQAYDAR